MTPHFYGDSTKHGVLDYLAGAIDDKITAV